MNIMIVNMHLNGLLDTSSFHQELPHNYRAGAGTYLIVPWDLLSGESYPIIKLIRHNYGFIKIVVQYPFLEGNDLRGAVADVQDTCCQLSQMIGRHGCCNHQSKTFYTNYRVEFLLC